MPRPRMVPGRYCTPPRTTLRLHSARRLRANPETKTRQPPGRGYTRYLRAAPARLVVQIPPPAPGPIRQVCRPDESSDQPDSACASPVHSRHNEPSAARP